MVWRARTRIFSLKRNALFLLRRSGPFSSGMTFISTLLSPPSSRRCFFPPGNDTAALLSAFATYAAGFLVRPFGAIIFGRIGDLVGRKYTFLVTITVMGASTVLVGVLPTFATIGFAAPTILVALRLLQGLALGGEYGGAATYVAEHAPEGKRGNDTSWIQTTATLGFFLSLVVILACRLGMTKETFASWGWRIPFLVSAFLLAFSIYIRLKLEQSPVFKKIKGEGKPSRPDRQLLPLSQQPAGPARSAWRDRWPGRGVVHGPVLRPVLPHHHAEAELRPRLSDDRNLARPRHAVLHLLRLAVGQDRTIEDHPGGLPDRSGHLLPAVRRADALRQSGP
jgi:MFS family permease